MYNIGLKVFNGINYFFITPIIVDGFSTVSHFIQPSFIWLVLERNDFNSMTFFTKKLRISSNSNILPSCLLISVMYEQDPHIERLLFFLFPIARAVKPNTNQ